MKEKKLLILGASELQVPAIKCANRLGYKSIVADYDPDAAGARFAGVFYNVSTLDYDKVLEVAKNEKVDGILTICSDRPMTIVAKVGEELGLNTVSVDTSIVATNKAKMRERLAERNVPVPMFSICRDFDEFSREIEKHTLPAIVKPSDNSGSRGVVLLENYDELKEAYEYAHANTADGIVLIEEYMVGPEVSVEVFVIDGKPQVIQITDKITTGPPHFVEMGHTQPSMLAENVRAEIAKIAIDATNALGIDRGPSHVEVKVTDSGVKIVELGARLGGDYIATDLVPLSTGFDMVEAAILTAAGEELPAFELKERFSAIRYFNYEHYINLTNEAVNSIERIFLNRVDKKNIESSRDREGFFIVSGESYEELQDKIKFVNDEIV